jgi:hypothetical protein
VRRGRHGPQRTTTLKALRVFIFMVPNEDFRGLNGGPDEPSAQWTAVWLHESCKEPICIHVSTFLWSLTGPEKSSFGDIG